MDKMSPDMMLAQDMGRFFDDPVGWVKYAFRWGEGELAGFDGLDDWQREELEKFAAHIRKTKFDGINAVEAYRNAVSSGHGIGKSFITAMIILFIMSTRPHCKGVVTANTSDQLKTKTWAELGKWKKRCITGHWFEYNNGKGNMNIYHKAFPESWRVDAQTCREENSESFAGLHCANSSPFYIFDEASAVPDKIWEVAEGGLTDGEPFWFVFGNPTRNSGRFRECFRKFRHRWQTRQVDSREARMTNKELIAQWQADYGEDSDFFKVRVRGIFPSTSFKQFISTLDVDAAFGRHLRPEQYNFAPKILTLDPAWEGDDEWVIGLRQGLHFQILQSGEKNDNDVELANILAHLEDRHSADAVHIDAGYGTGIASVGKTYGRDWRLVWFGGKSPDASCGNMRVYMWREMRDWLKAGGAIPDDDVLYTDLVTPETIPTLDGTVRLESKQDMKKRGLPSPNKADALALSFAFPVEKKASLTGEDRFLSQRVQAFMQHDFDPFEAGRGQQAQHDFDPFR